MKSVFVFLTEGKELWSFNGSSFKKIAEDVRSFKLAPFGGAVAYVDEEDTLFLYNGSKSNKVKNEIGSLHCISPDGKAVAYTVQEGENTKAYLYTGKEQELGKDIYPCALSDVWRSVRRFLSVRGGALIYMWYNAFGKGGCSMTALSIIIDIVLILISIVLIVTVLMQEGQRQGLGISGEAPYYVLDSVVKIILPTSQYIEFEQQQ